MSCSKRLDNFCLQFGKKRVYLLYPYKCIEELDNNDDDDDDEVIIIIIYHGFVSCTCKKNKRLDVSRLAI